jgi:glycosyltransferase involved in cell wall biosynthesis
MNAIQVVMLGPSLNQQGGMATVEKLIAYYPSPDVEISHISTHEEGSITRRLIVFGLTFVRLLEKLIQGKLDILHLHVSEGGSVLRIALLALMGFLLRKPVILHTHGCEFHLFYDRLPSVGKWAVSSIFRHCDYVITLSNSWRQYYISACNLAPDRVIVLYNPVEVPKQLPVRAGTSKVHFVFLGRIGHRKGAFDLVRAFSSLPPEHQMKVELTLAGDGEVESLQELVHLLGLQNQVHLLGWINIEQRNQLLSQADVFVLPSYNEGLPVALLEAMAWRLAVITTPIGGIPEMIKHEQNGILVQPGAIEQIVQAMQTLIENPSLRLSLAKAARLQVVSLDIDHYFNRLLSIYRSTIPGKTFSQDESASRQTLSSTRQG